MHAGPATVTHRKALPAGTDVLNIESGSFPWRATVAGGEGGARSSRRRSQLVALRDAAARWLLERGIRQWNPGEVALVAIQAQIATGPMAGRSHGDNVVAGLRLLWTDDGAWGVQPPVAALTACHRKPHCQGGQLGCERPTREGCGDDDRGHGDVRGRGRSAGRVP